MLPAKHRNGKCEDRRFRTLEEARPSMGIQRNRSSRRRGEKVALQAIAVIIVRETAYDSLNQIYCPEFILHQDNNLALHH